ncbi:MAG: M48 family metalloprotease [Fibrobacter sp.]|nr:M48 family metalloprotease [Fibrobacter sp.]
MESLTLLIVLLCAEFVGRVCLEIREVRLTMCRGGVFAILRVIPLINDIVPLPENRRSPAETEFVKKHEEGHRALRHAILRNIAKVILAMIAIWFLAAQLIRVGMPLWQGILWLHLVAIPFRVLFHLYCWNQEYEADAYAHKELGKQKTKIAMRELAECEIPYTHFFALMYREHPTAALRSKRLLNKVVRADGD